MSIWIGYASIALAAGSAFLFARRWYPHAEAVADRGTLSEFLDASRQPADPPFSPDVADATQTALERVGHLISRQFVSVDAAIPPGLITRMQQPILSDVIEEMLASAIEAAPASRLLMTGLRQGDIIEIVVTDDMQGADTAYRQGRIRDLSERVAVRGGVLQVAVRPAEGTATILRVMASAEVPVGPPLPAAPGSARSSYPAVNNTL